MPPSSTGPSCPAPEPNCDKRLSPSKQQTLPLSDPTVSAPDSLVADSTIASPEMFASLTLNGAVFYNSVCTELVCIVHSHSARLGMASSFSK